MDNNYTQVIMTIARCIYGYGETESNKENEQAIIKASHLVFFNKDFREALDNMEEN